MDVRPFGTQMLTGFIAATLLTTLTAACSGGSSSLELGGFGSDTASTTGLISLDRQPASFAITDMSGQPVPNAKIMIGPRENVPFPGNVLRTDEKGTLIAPSEWTDAQPVTIEATGYVRATFFAATPANTAFTLRRQIQFQKIELKGSTSGFGQLKTDGYLDVGLVLSGIDRSEVSSLNIANLISPEVDRMSVLGQELTIPSNVTFPDQSENYVFPIRFNKPQYRWYTAEPGEYKFIALHGRLPFKQTVDDLRARKSFFDIINTIDFKQGSFNDVTLASASQTQNFVVNSVQLSKSLSFTAPQYEAGNIVLAAAISQQGSKFFPTDLKNVAAGSSVRLAVPQTTGGTTGAALILASLRAKIAPTTGPASEFTSSVVLPANSSQAFEFLPRIAAPNLNNEVLSIEPPRLPTSALDPVLTFGSLSKIQLIRNGDIKVERKTPQWDVYAPNWVAQLELPVFPSTEPGTTEPMRWEVGFGAGALGQTQDVVGPKAVESLTHITRSALDL